MKTETNTTTNTNQILAVLVIMLAFHMKPVQAFTTKFAEGLAFQHKKLGREISNHVPAFFSVVSSFAPSLHLSFALQQDLAGNVDQLCDPFVDGEICSDVSNIALEMSPLAVKNSALTASALTVAGRAFAIAADFLPHHTFHPEQLVCQSVLLLAGLQRLVQSAEKTSMGKQITLRDARSYFAFFGPAGLSRSQFMKIVSNAAEYVSVNEGDIIEDEEQGEYLYYLYSGNVLIQAKNKTIEVSKSSVPRKSDYSKACPMGVWGDMRFTQGGFDSPSSIGEGAVLCGGKNGASLMRIHAPTLRKMMENDIDLRESVHSVLFKSLRDKALMAHA